MGTTAVVDRDRTERRPAAVLVAAELGTLALALGTAAGFTRLFLGWGFLGRLAVPVVLCWATSLGLRRARVRLRVAVPVSVAVAVVVLTWRFAPGTGWLGVPNGATLDALGGDLRASFRGFRTLIAPVPASTGFLVVLAAALWVFGTFADVAAFRFRAPVQAAVPYVATFVATGVLARDVGRAEAALWFGAGVAVYAVTQRGWQAEGRRWVRGERERGTRAVLLGAGAVVAVALLAGLVVGPLLPGGSDPVVDLRRLGRDGADRTVVSPFVSVRSLLGERSDQVVFAVAADRAAYWRLTALEAYDPARDIWTSRRSYRPAEGALPQQGPTPPGGEVIDQSYRVASLGGPWLPAAFEADRLDTEESVSWDPGTASLIAKGDGLEAGAAYRVRSAVPSVDPTMLTGTSIGSGLDDAYLADPGLDPAVVRTVRLATRTATGPYQTALALQEFFRTGFVYDETVDYSTSPDPTAAFMFERRGFCQQFASTFALLARSLGLPARVAVGFTPGDPTGDVDRAVTGVSGPRDQAGFVVRGRHAHAWPEVWFDDVGWLAFEPTPGRGDPSATSYTGVAPAQATAPAGEAATTSAPQAGDATTTTAAPGATTPGSGAVDAGDAPAADAGTAAGGGRWLVLGAVAVLVVAGGVWVLVRRRRRRPAPSDDPAGGRVAVAWAEALRWLAVLGTTPAPDETPFEFARRAARSLPALAGEEELVVLARAETVRRFGPVAPDDTTVAEAEAAAAALADRARELSTGADRARALVR